MLQRDAPYTITETDTSQGRAEERVRSGLLGHVISGARRSSSFSDEEVVETGAMDATAIRVNFFYTPQKVSAAYEKWLVVLLTSVTYFHGRCGKNKWVMIKNHTI